MTGLAFQVEARKKEDSRFQTRASGLQEWKTKREGRAATVTLVVVGVERAEKKKKKKNQPQMQMSSNGLP